MSLVAQHANDFRSQGFVQKFDDSFAVGSVALGNGAVLDVFPRALTQSLNVSEKWFISHSTHSLNLNFGGAGILLARKVESKPVAFSIFRLSFSSCRLKKEPVCQMTNATR